MFKGIRTGVIGVGSMGQNHARVLKEISNLVAVADINEEQGRMVAERFGVPWFGDYHEMLGLVDAAIIAVPTAFHREVTEEVAKASVHLLVEKPLADNAADAEAIVVSAEEGGIILAVGHIERHNPVVKYAKEAIESGEWGDVITMSSKRVSRYPARIKDVGVVFDLAIHDLDILCYLARSEVDSLFALGGNIEYSDKEDHVSIIMKFKNGIKGHCEASWLTPMKIRQLVLTCSEAYVVLDYMAQSVEIFHSEYGIIDESDLSKVKQLVDKKTPEIAIDEPLKLELLNFLEAVSQAQEVERALPLVSGEEGLAIVRLAEASVKAIQGK
jgi:UDP-N-acetylglucosamine 3-dehydrogenase